MMSDNMAWIKLLVLLSAFALVFGDEDDLDGAKCERITLPLCQDLGYNWTSMPNLLGHQDQKEAEEAMSVFADVLGEECSAHARFLLCSAFAPLCSEAVSRAVSACRALCEDVTRACGAALRAHNLTRALDCGLFPLRADRRLCMRPPNASDADPPPPRAAPAPPPPCAGGLAARDPLGEWECAPAAAACPEPAPAVAALQVWRSALAWAALGCTLLALATFAAAPARYRYPERPWVWAAACHALVAAAWCARGWLGGECGAEGAGAGGADRLSAACLAHFVTTHYLTLAADAWFCGACAAWYLSACGEWSAEALERCGAYVHAAAWGWAGGWTAAALALRRVSRKRCSADPALEAVPRGAALLAALCLAAAAAAGVRRVRRALPPAGARRVLRAGSLAAARGALYWVLAAAALALRVWAAGGAGGEVRATLAECLCLAGGAAAGTWAWSRKSSLLWRRGAGAGGARAGGKSPPALLPPAPPPPPLLHPYYKRPLHVSRV